MSAKSFDWASLWRKHQPYGVRRYLKNERKRMRQRLADREQARRAVRGLAAGALLALALIGLVGLW